MRPKLYFDGAPDRFTRTRALFAATADSTPVDVRLRPSSNVTFSGSRWLGELWRAAIKNAPKLTEVMSGSQAR